MCVNRVCVEKSSGAGANGGTNSSGGFAGDVSDAGSGGTSAVSGGGSSGSAGSGGSGKGGSAGVAGKGGSGGSAGTAGSDTAGMGGAPEPECETNGDCIDANADQPFLCRDGSCVAITNADCPVLLPGDSALELLRQPAPLIVGGFASLTNDQDPMDSVAVINWDLAFDEFNDRTGGGFPNPEGGVARRPVLAVVCKSATSVTDNMAHLAETVGVRAVLSTLPASSLQTAYSYTRDPAYVSRGGDPVFFMSTGSADITLANLLDNGLIWHQLGSPRVLARTMASLLALVEPHVNLARQAFFQDNPSLEGVEDPGAVPLRVTLVYSDDPTVRDIATVLTDPSDDTSTMLFFNGQAAIDQIGDGGADPGDFRQVEIESIRLHTDPNVAPGIEELQARPPHVIVAMGTAEFAGRVIPAIENQWTTDEDSASLPRPFYLLSHLIYNSAELRTTLGAAHPSLQERILGVNYASAQDAKSQALYQSYLARLQSSYDGNLPLAGSENMYDGAYSLLYALAAAAASRTVPHGLDVRDGLDQVYSTNLDATPVDIGPSNIQSNVSKLTTDLGYEMAMWGTMGPPDFDRATGTRVTATSAWCIEGSGTSWTYRADGLLYDPETGSYTAPDTIPACIADFAPPPE